MVRSAASRARVASTFRTACRVESFLGLGELVAERSLALAPSFLVPLAPFLGSLRLGRQPARW